MDFSARFITRPVATALLALGVAFAGLACYLQLPIAGVPQVDIPTIQVFAALPGASAETMAATVAVPLERQLALIPGITEMSSSSVLGNSNISLQFDVSRSIDGAAQDVQAAINNAAGDLPKNLPHPPTFQKANPSDALLLSIAVSSDTLPIAQVDELAEDYLTPELARIPGVGMIDFHGQQKPAVRVQANPARLAAMGLSLEELRAALVTATTNTPKGTLNGERRAVTLDASDQLMHAADYAAIIVAYRNGAPVRLSDVATVLDSVEDLRQTAWVDGQQAVIADIHKQIGYNINQTVARIKEQLPLLQKNLPAAVKLTLLQDRTSTIRQSVTDIQITLLLTVLLVVLVVFAFVHELRSTVIPAVAIPLSMLGTAIVMALLGYTLDNVSLMALTVVVGFVVDDAIVMTENVLRHIEAGQKPLRAAIDGAREIGLTIVSMTVSLVAVFIPLLFMGGLIGRLFREFAVTAAVAIVMSGLVSLTLTPMMCARMLHHIGKKPPGRFARGAERLFRLGLDGYARSLRLVMAHRRLTAAFTLLVAAASVALYIHIPKGFFPPQDNGLIAGVAEGPSEISFDQMSRRINTLAAMVAKDPDVTHVYYWVDGHGTIHLGRVSLDLLPFGRRHDSVYDVIDRIHQRLAGQIGLDLHLQARQDVTIGARVTKTQYQYTLHDANVQELQQWAPRLMRALATLPQLQDVATDLEPDAPGLRLELDRNAMSHYGVSTQMLDDTLYDAYGQRQVANFYTEVNTYRVILEVEPRFQQDAGALSLLYIGSDQGNEVPISAVARLVPQPVPLSVSHDGQLPAVTLSFNLAPGYSLGQAVDAVQARIRQEQVPLSLSGDFSGTAEVFRSSLASQPYLIAAALLAIYIVLGMLYENLVHPITILSTLPSGGLGALLALLLFRIDFSLIALIGVILLIGIVKKNGIMMVDFALAREREEGLAPDQAIYQACLLRFRPIMMTTFAALLGALPLAFGSGAGSELRRPLGVTMVGGLLISQVLTLYTTPVIYLYMHRFNDWIKRKLGSAAHLSDAAA